MPCRNDLWDDEDFDANPFGSFFPVERSFAPRNYPDSSEQRRCPGLAYVKAVMKLFPPFGASTAFHSPPPPLAVAVGSQVGYDNTVRDGEGCVHQFMYGEDGVDTTQSK